MTIIERSYYSSFRVKIDFVNNFVSPLGSIKIRAP